MPQRDTRRIRATACARAGWACLLLFAPVRVLRAGGRRVPAQAVTLVRVLGARHLLQSVVTGAAPTRPVTGVGAAVDALHAGTDLALAAMSVRWRRLALIDASVGAAFVAAGIVAAGSVAAGTDSAGSVGAGTDSAGIVPSSSGD